MALGAPVDGTVQTAVPGGGAALQVGAHATLQGTLATAAAQLQLQARLKPAPTSEAATPPVAAPASKPGASKSLPPRATPAHAADPIQADLTATLAPWAQQPLQSANATLRAVNLAALWPQAPVTQLHGTLQAGPTSGGTGTAGWSLQAALRNDLPGPWDTARLPLTALDASASYDGTRWTVPSATLQAGAGRITALQPPMPWRARPPCARCAPTPCTRCWPPPHSPAASPHKPRATPCASVPTCGQTPVRRRVQQP